MLRSNGKTSPPHVLTTTNRRHGGRTLPGGKVEPGESPRDAVLRELCEETAIVVDKDALVQLVVGDNEVDGEVCEVGVYLAFFARGEPRDVEEGTAHEWLAWDDLLLSSPFAGFYQRHFPDGVAHIRPTTFA